MFPFVFRSFEAQQTRRAITPMARLLHVRLIASRGSRAGGASARGDRASARGHRTPAPRWVGEAGPGEPARTPRGCPLLPGPCRHRAPRRLALLLSPPDKPSSQAGPLSSPQRRRQPPLLPPAHGTEAFRLVFAGVHTNLAFPVPTPPFPAQLNSAIEPSEWFISQVSTKQGSLCAPGTSRTKRTKTLEGHL